MLTPSTGGMTVSDPLAEWPQPAGNPAQVQAAKNQLDTAAGKLEGTSSALTGAVGGVVGQAWVGRASASCSEAVGQVATKYGNAATYADDAAATLAECARRWEAALGKYAEARRLATTAMDEEREFKQRTYTEAAEYSTSGDEPQAQARRDAAETYSSPLRMRAISMAREASSEFDAATQQAIGKLDAAAHDLTAAGALTSPSQTEKNVATLGTAGGIILGHYKGGTDLFSGNWYSSRTSRWVADRHPMRDVVQRGALVGDEAASKLKTAGKVLGRSGTTLGLATSFAGQWRKDSRRHPNMATDEQAARATTEGVSAAAGSTGGAYAGAAIGTMICPGVGTAIGGIVGGGVGGWAATQINDGAVDAVGDAVENLWPW